MIKLLPNKTKSKLKLKELPDFENIISKSTKPRFLINKKEVKKEKNYVLCKTSFSSEKEKISLNKLIYNIKKCKDNELVIVIRLKSLSLKYILSILRFLFKNRNEENIIINFQTWNELIGEIYFIEFLKNINTIIINDLDVNHIDYLSIAKQLNLEVYINAKYEKQFKLSNFEFFDYQKIGSTKYLKDKDKNLKIFKKLIFNDLKNIKNKNYLTKKGNFKYDLILYRIIGNDMPPLQGDGQLIKNVKYIVENEKIREGFKRIWVLNRIHDSQKLNKIKTFLETKKEEYKEIEFVYEEFINQKFNINKNILLLLNNHFWYKADEKKTNLFVLLLKNFNNYATNINQARNFCLNDGKREKCKWVFPLDGNIFIPEKNLLKIIDKLNSTDKSFLIMPMKRINKISEIGNINDTDFSEEPQVGFRLNKNIFYDESYCYGYRPKVNLLKRIMIFDKFNIFRNTRYDYLLGFEQIKSTFIDYEWTEGVLRLPYYEQIINKRGPKRTLSIYKLLNKIFMKYNNKVYKKLNLKNFYLTENFKKIRKLDNNSSSDERTKYIIDYLVKGKNDKELEIKKILQKNFSSKENKNECLSEINLYIDFLNIQLMEEIIENYEKKILFKLKSELKNNINYLYFRSKQYISYIQEIDIFNRIFISNLYQIINNDKNKLLDNYMLLFININYYSKKYFSDHNYLSNLELLKSLRKILDINFIFIYELNLNIFDSFPSSEKNNLQQILLELVDLINNKVITTNNPNYNLIYKIVNIYLSQSQFIRDYNNYIKINSKEGEQFKISDFIQIYSLYSDNHKKGIYK
jgi:hypothetical protein